ncbi:LysM peptidoglycan-binding domain-containing protein, partial [Trichothermofontia sp.]
PAATDAPPQPVTTNISPDLLATPTTDYVVQPGDTLRTIANKVLRPGSDWRILATLNNIADPRQIRVGQRLRIPQRGSHITGEPTGTAAGAGTAAAPPLAPVPPAATTELGQTYVVQPGETLTTIASKALGPGGDWRVIAELNQIADPKQVRAGQRLRIPTRS